MFNVILPRLESMGISTRGTELENVGAIINRDGHTRNGGYISNNFMSTITQRRLIVGDRSRVIGVDLGVWGLL
jgi:hypothetical protein